MCALVIVLKKKSFDCIFFAENCSDPSKDTNAKVIGDVFSHGNEVKFVCPKDYILIPESSEILTCDDGKWTGILPSCKGMKDMMYWKTFSKKFVIKFRFILQVFYSKP